MKSWSRTWFDGNIIFISSIYNIHSKFWLTRDIDNVGSQNTVEVFYWEWYVSANLDLNSVIRYVSEDVTGAIIYFFWHRICAFKLENIDCIHYAIIDAELIHISYALWVGTWNHRQTNLDQFNYFSIQLKVSANHGLVSRRHQRIRFAIYF